MNMESGIYIAIFGIGIILFFCYSQTGRLWRSIFFTAFSGIGTLGLLLLTAKAIGVNIALTPLSLMISGLLGIPGVLAMLVINIL